MKEICHYLEKFDAESVTDRNESARAEVLRHPPFPGNGFFLSFDMPMWAL